MVAHVCVYCGFRSPCNTISKSGRKQQPIRFACGGIHAYTLIWLVNKLHLLFERRCKILENDSKREREREISRLEVISSLYGIVQFVQEIPLDKQRLIFHGKVLKDDQPLKEYGTPHLLWYSVQDVTWVLSIIACQLLFSVSQHNLSLCSLVWQFLPFLRTVFLSPFSFFPHSTKISPPAHKVCIPTPNTVLCV